MRAPREHHHHCGPNCPEPPWVKEFRATLARIEKTTMTDKATLDSVLAKVGEEGTVEDGVVTLLQQLLAMSQGSGDAQAKLDAITAAIQGNEDKLAAAVVANTPAA